MLVDQTLVYRSSTVLVPNVATVISFLALRHRVLLVRFCNRAGLSVIDKQKFRIEVFLCK